MADTAVAGPEPPSTLNPDAPEFVPQGPLLGFHSLPASPALVPQGSRRGARNRSFTDIAMMSPLLGPLAPLPPLLDPLVAAAMLEMSMTSCTEDNDDGEDEWSGSGRGRLRLMSQEEIVAATNAQSHASGTRQRKSPTSRRSSTTSGAPEGEEKAESRRSSARRSTNSADMPSQVSTLVVKSLSLDLQKQDVLRYLEERGAAAMDVDLHLDASGAFRGTAFARYASPGKAKVAMEKLGTTPDIGGRKARVEIQKSKTSFGRKCLEAELPQQALEAVREHIEAFAKDPARCEVELPAGLSVQQRKYAHSLAERHNLVHATRQGETGEKFVYLSKGRPEPADVRKKSHSVSYPSVALPTPQGSKQNRRASAPASGTEAGYASLTSESSAEQRGTPHPSSDATPTSVEIKSFSEPPVAFPPGLELEKRTANCPAEDFDVDLPL